MNTIIIFAASYLYLVILAFGLGIFLFSTPVTRWNLVKLALVVFPLCFIVAQLSTMVIVSPRPFVVDHIPALIPSATDNGFPSDHTLLAMAVAAIIFVYYRKLGSILLILALCVGIGRVLAHVHHPIDVIGSTVIALSITALGHRFVANTVFPDRAQRQENNP